MASKKTKPGEHLSALLNMKQLISSTARTLGKNLENETNADMDAHLASIVVMLGLDIDGYKALVDMLLGEAYEMQNKSDEFLRTADSLAYSIDYLMRVLQEKVQGTGAQIVVGETWEAQLLKQPARIIIDPVVLAEKHPEFMQSKTVTSPDEAKIIEALNAGIPIEGIEIKPQFKVQMAAIKKEPKGNGTV